MNANASSPPAWATTSHSSGAQRVAGERERRREQHRQRLPRRAGARVEVPLGDLAAPDDPRPRVVRRAGGQEVRERREREAAEHQQPPRPRPGARCDHRSARAERIAAGSSSTGSISAPGSPHSANAAVERGERDVGGRREVARAALEQHLVAREQHPLGGLRRRVVLDAELELVGLELVEPGGAERGEQLEARRAAEAGQREPLEHAREAALRRPVGLAGEAGGLRAGALGPLAVGGDRAGVAGRQLGGLAVLEARRGGGDRVLELGGVGADRARAGRRARSPARGRARSRPPRRARAARAARRRSCSAPARRSASAVARRPGTSGLR